MTEIKYHVGIDLHGTLINNEENIAAGAENELIELIKKKPDDIKLYICTGNDLPFVKRKIGKLFDLFDGAVLETGCVVSDDKDEEKIIVSKDIAEKIKELENTLIDCDYSEVYKFARRLSTISMFTKYDASLQDFYNKISEELKLIDYARVTRSSVAVDIVPLKHDKYKGLDYFAKDKDVLVAVADSLNDIEWLKQSDISYMPGNADQATVYLLSETREKRELKPGLDKNGLYIAEKNETFGVIEILKHLFENYRKF